MENLAIRFGVVEICLGVPAIVSAALLAGAHIFEAMGYAPCDLCLDQREAHWTALTVALAGLAASLVFRAPLAATAAVGALALVYLLSAGLAFYHTGVEFGYWPGPASCSGAVENIGVVDLSAAMSAGVTSPSCSEAAWRLLGVSMAGYNFLISAGLFVLSFGAALSTSRRVRSTPLGGPSIAE